MHRPVLYSYRRCPYAMRARMALRYANIDVEVREIVLREKPAQMLAVSPKGTVPVLVLASGQVLEQSLDIINWALEQSDMDGWIVQDQAVQKLSADLIATNDGDFKQALDKYKYAIRFPENPPDVYRAHYRVPISIKCGCSCVCNYIVGITRNIKIRITICFCTLDYIINVFFQIKT